MRLGADGRRAHLQVFIDRDSGLRSTALHYGAAPWRRMLQPIFSRFPHANAHAVQPSHAFPAKVIARPRGRPVRASRCRPGRSDQTRATAIRRGRAMRERMRQGERVRRTGAGQGRHGRSTAELFRGCAIWTARAKPVKGMLEVGGSISGLRDVTARARPDKQSRFRRRCLAGRIIECV